MADATTVVEGKIKYREGKKWKLRWCVLKKPSPVADRLQLMLYKDVHQALRAGGRIKTSFPLEGYFGLESGFTFDKENNVLAIICQKQITLLAFETRDYLIQFEIKVRQSLGQDDRFPVQLVKVPVGSRLPLESVNLLIHGVQFCLTAQVPPRILHSWNVSDLRRFGAVEGKFCFEGGSRCGKGAGVHALQTDQAEVIAEILQRNSLGKSAPCLRTANNRSSQILDYNLAVSDPTRSYAETQPFAVCSSGFIPGPSPERLGMLGCCQAVAGNEPDEWGCRKRHSVSVTDFHRAGTATFQEKLRLMSIENLERQRLMAIYDVPPKHPRKLEMPAPSAPGVGAEKETCAVSVELESQAFHSQKQTSHLTVKLEATKEVTEGHLDELQPSSRAVTSLASSASREYCVPRSLNSTLFDSIVNAQVDTTKRHEALQRLVKQESHLHQEIILLDQMLQGCHPDDEADKKENSGRSPDISGNKIGTCKFASPILSSTPISVHQKASSLPPKNKNMEFNTANVLQPITSASDNCMMYLREKGAKDTFCPDFLSKLEKIPCHSHLNTPLPYVNLAKYDEEMDGSHIHIPGNAEWNTAAISALKSTLHRNPVGGSLASLGVGQSKNGQICGLPARCHSETHIVSIASDAQVDLSVHQESLSSSNPQDSSRMSINLKCISSTNMFLEDDSILPPTTFAPPVPYPRTLIASGTLGDMPTVDVPPSTYAPPIPSTPQVLTLSSAIREPIYANEPPPPPPPPRKISDTPPPDLPPKGPALIRKSKHRNANNNSASSEGVPPPPPVRTRSLSVGSQGKFYGYDNQPATTTVLPENSSKSEDNYLPMGSPKVKPRSREQKTTESFQKEEDSRPISAIFSSSTKSHGNGMPASVRRGNADVLSGYMDMANMFIEEPKQNDYLENSDISRHGSMNSRELNMSEPILNNKQADASAVDSNYLYMEMSSLPPPPKRKSVVLKNLEALQTYLSTTGGDSFHKPSAAYGRHRENIRDPLRPAIPFVNLKNFEQKQIKSYVNTYIPTRDIPLPEPPKKEEGFFARLIRRNSKDKVTTQSQENLNAPKNRASVFERSLSEQGEEKVNSKLKVGRRRSASFPNRLSFQETATSTGTQPTSKKDTPPPPPPPPRTSMPATYIAVQQTLASSQDSHSGNDEQKKQTADATSLHDLSDDSDLAPLLKNEGKKNDTRVLTVLHVQQDFSAQKIHMYTDLTSDKCNGDSIYYKLSDSTYSVSDSSKTDDEKLIELLTSSKRQSFAAEISNIKSKMSLPLVPAGKHSPSEEAAAIARHVASVPPFIPPKTKKLQLSPVKELASPITLPPSLQPLQAPPQHPHLPSAPNQDEAIYVDMKELLPQHGPASPTNASHHPYNCPREQKQRARATLRITPAVEDEEGNIWVPRKDIVSGEAPTPLSLIDPPPHLPGLSPRLPPNFVSRFSPRPGETPSSLSELHYSTPLVVSVDPLEGAGEGMAECLSLSSRGSSSCQSQCSIEPGVRTSPAATVLRPRSGRDYQVVERRCLGSSSLSSSPAARSPTYSTVFTYDVCSADPKSPGSSSMSSWHSRERESSPFKHCHWQHSPALPFASSRDQTHTPKSGDLFTRSVRDTGSPPKIFRTDRRAKSEPCTGGPESPVAISHSVKSSPPNSPQVPNLPVFAPEQLEPMLNYAEIDLTMPSSPPPVETFSKRQKKVPPKATVIEYTQIDHTATNALKRAGLEHAQAREDSLRRAITPNISFSKFSYKDRKGSSNSSRERKLSTSSSDSI